MYEDILKKSLMLWDMLGHHPAHFVSQAVVISLVLMVSTLALAFYQMIRDNGIPSIVASVNSCGIICIGLVFWTLVVTKRKALVNYMGLIKRFWNIDRESTSAENIAHNKILRFTGSVCNVFIGYCALTICFVIISGYFGYLPLPCYVPGEINFYLFASYNNLTTIFTLCLLVSAHCFIFCNIMFLITQFKLLNKAFSVIDYAEISSLQQEVCLREIRSCIEHHHFLLRCCTEFSGLVGLSYVQFISLLTLMLCILAYIVATQNEFLPILRSMVYFLGIALTHLFLYCLPSKHLSIEISNLSDSIFSSNWYDCRQLSITKSLLIIMTRTQKETVISFRGFVKMDLVIFMSSMKMAFSVYTFLQNIKN